jgi:hypothetical protein
LKKTYHIKRAGGVAQSVDPEFKPQNHTHIHTQKNTHNMDGWMEGKMKDV